MIVRTTVIDQIEKSRDGNVGVRIALMIIDEGVELAKRWHRVVMRPQDDTASLVQEINSNLIELGESPLTSGDVEMLTQERASGWRA